MRFSTLTLLVGLAALGGCAAHPPPTPLGSAATPISADFSLSNSTGAWQAGQTITLPATGALGLSIIGIDGPITAEQLHGAFAETVELARQEYERGWREGYQQGQADMRPRPSGEALHPTPTRTEERR